MAFFSVDNFNFFSNNYYSNRARHSKTFDCIVELKTFYFKSSLESYREEKVARGRKDSFYFDIITHLYNNDIYRAI